MPQKLTNDGSETTRMVDMEKRRTELGSKALLDFLRELSVEYSDMAYVNNVRYATDEEIELVRRGRYGEMAINDLISRIE
jgi:hypothetical protein